MEILICLLAALVWYGLLGWAFAAWVWTRELDLETDTVVAISIFSIFGPIMGFTWLFAQLFDTRPPRKPKIWLRSRGSR